MSPEKRPRPKRSSIESEEKRTWVEFYRRVRGDAALAAEVLSQLERDAEMKRAHLALYLTCKETLRREKARQVRHKRIGFFIRWLVHSMLVKPWQDLRKFGSESRDIAVEMLPEPRHPHQPAPQAAMEAPTALPPSSTGAISPVPRRNRKARPDAASAAAEQANQTSS